MLGESTLYLLLYPPYAPLSLALGMKMTVYEDGQAQSALARWTFNYLISTPPLVRSSPIDDRRVDETYLS